MVPTVGGLLRCLVPKRALPNMPLQKGLSPLAAGYMWASKAGNLGLQMILPALLGFWADNHWATRPLFTIIGALLGFGLFMIKLLALVQELSAPESRPGAENWGSAKSQTSEMTTPSTGTAKPVDLEPDDKTSISS